MHTNRYKAMIIMIICILHIYHVAMGDNLFVTCTSSHGCYLYDAKKNIVGYLLNGCPIDESFIIPTELGETLSDNSNTSTLFVNKKYVVYEGEYIGKTLWAYGRVFYSDTCSVYDRHPVFCSDATVIGQERRHGLLEIMGIAGEYFIILYSGHIAYVNADDITLVIERGGNAGIKYDGTLRSYRYFFTQCIPTGNELISRDEAIEIARALVEKSKYVFRFDVYSARYSCSQIVSIGPKKTAWVVMMVFENEVYRILVSTLDGAVLQFEMYSEGNG